MRNKKATEEIVKAVKRFSAKMRDQLVDNLDKGGWKDESSAYLLRHLLEEVAELVQELDQGTPESIEAEAVDVANFAMMIADPERTRTVMEG